MNSGLDQREVCQAEWASSSEVIDFAKPNRSSKPKRLVVTIVLIVLIVTFLHHPVAAAVVVKYEMSGLRVFPPTINIVKTLDTRGEYLYLSYIDNSNVTGFARISLADLSTNFYTLSLPFPSHYVSTFDLDENGMLWFISTDSSVHSSLHRLDMTTGQIVTWSFDQFITGMCIENAGSIWLTGSFVGHFEPLSGVFEMYELKAPSVTCAFNPILTNGKIWTIAMEAIPLTGFSGNKLMSFDPFDPSFQAYYQLPADHNALGMTKDIEGDLWTISSNGFTRFNVVSGTCTLVESAYSCRKACSDGNGNIYFISDVFESIGSSIVRFSSKDQSFTEYWRSTYWTLFGMTIVDITVLRGEYQQR